MSEEQRWLEDVVRPHLIQCKVNFVTVALMTEAEFRDSWELGKAVVVYPDDSYKLLGFGGRPVPNSECTIEAAVDHIWTRPEESLYLWPGDQSDEFVDYPRRPLAVQQLGIARLKSVLLMTVQMLRDLPAR